MARKEIKMAEDVAPNLVPMIDIMFLLLLFFMLSADMGQRELEEVRLPLAKTVKKDDEAEKVTEEGSDRVTVNVYHRYPSKGFHCAAYDSKLEGEAKPVCREDEHWKVGIKGVDFKLDKLEEKLKKEAELAPSKDPKNPKISERKVMIRVDELAPYGHAQKVMNLCAKAGIYKIEVGAAQPEEEKKPKGGH